MVPLHSTGAAGPLTTTALPRPRRLRARRSVRGQRNAGCPVGCRAVPAVGAPARPPGSAFRVGQPHLPPRPRAFGTAAERTGVRTAGREGAPLAAAPGAAPAAADPGPDRARAS